MLFVTTCCIYKSTSYIYLFNYCTEKSTISTRPRLLRDQISQEILVGMVIFLCLSKIYLSSFTWSKLHIKSQDEIVSIRSLIFHILAILLRTSQVNIVWVLKLLWPGKPALWFDEEITLSRQFIYKNNYCTILRSLEAFLFQMNRDNIGNSVDLIWLANVLCLLSDYRKEEIIRSINLINGFGPRSYSIRGIHLPIVLLT